MIPTVENILATYLSSSPAAVSEGLRWYDDAHALAVQWSPTNVALGAGAIAALSPVSTWVTNKAWAVESIRTRRAVGNTLANRNKCQRILDGENPNDVFATSPKVRSFYQTILDPTDVSVSPVIDRHAFSIAVGEWTDAKVSSKVLGRKGVYEMFADAYRIAAAAAGIGSAQMQAITWVAFRESRNLEWAG